jgi:hypothetical protein
VFSPALVAAAAARTSHSAVALGATEASPREGEARPPEAELRRSVGIDRDLHYGAR